VRPSGIAVGYNLTPHDSGGFCQIATNEDLLRVSSVEARVLFGAEFLNFAHKKPHRVNYDASLGERASM
jgi:hypothetical protein